MGETWDTKIEVKETVDVNVKTPEIDETKEYDGNMTIQELVQKIGSEYSIANLNLYTNGDEVSKERKDEKIGTLSGIEAISKTVGNTDGESDSEETKPVEDGENTTESEEKSDEEVKPESTE